MRKVDYLANRCKFVRNKLYLIKNPSQESATKKKRNKSGRSFSAEKGFYFLGYHFSPTVNLCNKISQAFPEASCPALCATTNNSRKIRCV